MEEISDSMKIITYQIRRVIRRLQWLRLIEGFWYGVLSGVAAANLWFVAGRFWPIHGLWIYASASFVMLLLACCLWGYFRKITAAEAARTMDKGNLKQEQLDAMATALSFAKSESLPAQMQRNQAVKYGEEYIVQIKRKLPVPRRRKWWIASAAGILLLALFVTLPSPMDEILAQQNKEKEWANTQKQETEQRIKELENYKLDPIQRESLNQELMNLKNSISESKEPEKMLGDVETAMKKLKEMSDKLELKERNRESWLDEWKKNSSTEGLSKSLKGKNKEALSEEMKSLRNKLSSMNPQQKQELAEQLKKLADTAPKDDKDAQALADALKKAADAIGKGNQEQVEQALKQLEEALQKNIEASNAEAQQSEAAEALAMALAKQGMGLAENMAASGLAVSDSWSMGGAADQVASGGSGSSGDASDSSESFDGSGLSSGSGAGGAGNSGQAGGSGTGGNGNGSSGGKGQGSGQGNGTGAGAGLGSGGRTLITAPRDLKGSGNVQQDGGPSTGGNVQKGGNSPIFDGVSRPYEEVYSDYATEAKRSLERSELPQNMQSLVESYFVEIEPGS
ncbi:hypothetical protein D3C76_625030 [compost metagenome]